jgi:DNA invertase Pin-like site-specific DNA recombinase
VNARIAAPRKRGKYIRRPRKLTPEQVAHVREVTDGGLQTPVGMAGLLGATLWRSMRRLEASADGRR